MTNAASHLERLVRGPSTFRGKVALGLTVLLGAVAVFLLTYVPAHESRRAMSQLADNAESIAEIVAYNLVPGVLFEDPETIEDIVASARRNDDIRYVIVEDRNGRRLGGFVAAGTEMGDYHEAGRRTPAVTETLFKMDESIRHDGRQIGSVYMGYSTEEARAQIAQSRLRLALVMAGAFALALVGVLLLSSRLTRPLSRIVQAAEDISAGDLSRRSHVSSDDEVGRLARTFDSMVERLESAQGELQGLNRGLEERVTERTRELRDALAEASASERHAKENEQRFRTVFDSAAMGFALIDPSLRLVEVNRAFEAMWQAPADALIGRSVEGLFDARDVPEAMERLADVLAGTLELAEAEIRYHPADGSEAWGRGVVSPVRGPDGKVPFAIAMVQDITEQRTLADRLRESQKLDAVGRLAGGIAHDFNNLLMVINSMSELMLSDLRGADHLKEDLEQIKCAGQRAADLTRQLLAFSRRQSLNPRPLDVNVTIREMGALLRRLIGEDLALDYSLAPSLPQVKADPSQLGQVIMNLAVNARDAMPQGGRLLIETATLEVSHEQAAAFDTSAGPAVQIAVTDTGVGMDAETLSHIFEPFFTTKQPGKGTGLGLATVYGVVKQSGGGITVKSQPGKGTTFLIVIPVATGLDVVTESTAQQPALGGQERILVVEDEESVRAITTRILRQKGYNAVECESGMEALEVIARNPGWFHAVVTDVIMPGMSGPEMASRLAKSSPELPVLFVSGYPREELVKHGVEDLSERFIQKPMTPDQLAAAVRRLLDARHPRAAAA